MKNLTERLLSIDIMRGFTLFLMLFVNDLYTKGVPKWLLHTEADVDGMGLADWVFPGFLFMVGISIPFAITNRIKSGDSLINIFQHILFRAASLIFISLMIFNINKLNVEYVGVSKFIWAIILYTAIFLVWNNYPKVGINDIRYRIFQGLGILILLIMVLVFRSGNIDDLGWLERGWWGILGLIGWGYLAGALGSLWCGGSLIKCSALCVFFLAINILHSANFLGFLSVMNPVFNVLIEGNIPFIVLIGVLVGLLIKKHKDQPLVLIRYILLMAFGSLLLGFFLRNWFIISKIYATPSWGLICNGISLAMFVMFYYLIDVRKYLKGLKLFRLAGQNSLTTYLIPDIVYLIIWTCGFPVFFYKYLDNTFWCIFGSLLWAYVMLWCGVWLSRLGVKLKL